MAATIPHETFFNATVQLIPVLLLAVLVQRRASFWGTKPGTAA